MSGRDIEHLFINADKPSYPMSLPLDKEFEIVRTTVEVIRRGSIVAFDEIVFRHYVKITRRPNGTIKPATPKEES